MKFQASPLVVFACFRRYTEANHDRLKFLDSENEFCGMLALKKFWKNYRKRIFVISIIQPLKLRTKFMNKCQQIKESSTGLENFGTFFE